MQSLQEIITDIMPPVVSGYKLGIRVFPNGAGFPGYFSIYICFYDNPDRPDLTWPFCKPIKIQIRNSESQKENVQRVLNPDGRDPIPRPTSRKPTERGFPMFFKTSLLMNKNSGFLTEDGALVMQVELAAI